MSEQPKELYSLLIPLQGERLLVPRVCVAEVIAFVEPDPTGQGTDQTIPDWYLGRVEWNGRRVPVLSFEGFAGEATKKRAGRTRIVIFHALGGEQAVAYYGVITQGFPQLVRVSPDVLSADVERTYPEELPVLCRTRMINEYPLIPDMERLESMLGELAA